METLYPSLLSLHVGSGAFALAAFWIAMLLSKGGVRHRRAGLAFVVAMGLSAGVALVMSVAVVADPGLRHGAVRGQFAALAGFAGLTLWLLFSGVRAVRQRRTRPHRWVVRHLVGVLGASVIGHTAFVVSLVPMLVPGIYARDPAVNLLPWAVPPLAGIVLIALACRHYAPRFAAPPAPAKGGVGVGGTPVH